MSYEIELKFLLHPELLPSFSKILQELGAVPQTSLNLTNIYFDTPDWQLHQAKAALRLRFNGSQWLQTLKTSGTDLGGLSCRNEWEMPVPAAANTLGASLDLSLFPAEAWPAACNQDALEAKFSTNFKRHLWLFTQTGAKPCQIEIAADFGEVASLLEQHKNGQAATSLPIQEVELELKQGAPSAVLDVAATIAQQLPFKLSSLSKAEKGLRLIQQLSAPEEYAQTLPAADFFAVKPKAENLEKSLQETQASLQNLRKMLESKPLSNAL